MDAGPVGLDRIETFAAGLDHPEGITVTIDGRIFVGGEAGQIYRIEDDDTFTEVANTADSSSGSPPTPPAASTPPTPCTTASGESCRRPAATRSTPGTAATSVQDTELGGVRRSGEPVPHRLRRMGGGRRVDLAHPSRRRRRGVDGVGRRLPERVRRGTRRGLPVLRREPSRAASAGSTSLPTAPPGSAPCCASSACPCPTGSPSPKTAPS